MRICYVFVLLSVTLAVGPCRAFEQIDCLRQETTRHLVKEPIKSLEEYSSARNRALDSAGQLAIVQVVGVEIQSSRESETKIEAGPNATDARQRFEQLEKSDLAGLVRPRIDSETMETTGDQKLLVFDIEVTVCVPKPDYSEKRRKEWEVRNRAAPKPADPRSHAWFDPKTGQPQLWFWRDGDRAFEFFDNDGFHPQNGEKLQPVTSKTAADWKTFEARQAQREEDLRRKQEQEAADEALRRQRAQQAPDTCDELAANPNDRAKPANVVGAPFEYLRGHLDQAIAACTEAVGLFPNELRFKYQLARALQVTSPQKAKPLLEELTSRNYAAAFDNYGWLFLDSRLKANAPEKAATIFRRGVRLNDPDSMHSLATLILKGRIATAGSGEVAGLLQNAANLGHQEAAADLQRLRDDELREQQRRLQEQKAMEAIGGIIGGFIQGVPRGR